MKDENSEFFKLEDLPMAESLFLALFRPRKEKRRLKKNPSGFGFSLIQSSQLVSFWSFIGLSTHLWVSEAAQENRTQFLI
jgi:hypothetical protein